MRIFNRVHVPWFIFVCLATGVAALLYLANFHPDLVPFFRLPAFFGEVPPAHQTVGGTPLGIIFGGISFGIFIFAALLSLRKKIPLWRIGTVQRWLRAHIWLTFLTVPLILFHCGFQLGGPMTMLLMTLYGVVMISGIYGLILQHQMPRLMKDRLPAETVYEQIPFIRAQLCAAAIKMRDSLKPAPPTKTDAGAPAASTDKSITTGVAPMASTVREVNTPTARAKTAVGSTVTAAVIAPPPAASEKPAKASAPPGDPASEAVLVEFLDRQVLPYLQAHRGYKHSLGDARFSDNTFRFIKLRVTENYRARVEEVQGWCDERRMLASQARMHHWLHGWLFLHVPASFLLLFLTAWHACVTLFRY